MRAWTCVVALGLVGCVAPTEEPPAAPRPKPPAAEVALAPGLVVWLGTNAPALRRSPQSARIEEDLELLLAIAPTGTIVEGTAPEVHVEVFNRGSQRTHAFVHPVDSWLARESQQPRIELRVEAEIDGTFRPLHAPRVPCRCGPKPPWVWGTSAQLLAPGDSTPVAGFAFPAVSLAGVDRVRVTAIYHYDPLPRSDFARLAGLGELPDIPSFQLASAPVVLRVEHPLALSVSPGSGGALAPGVPLARLFDVVLENQSGAPLASGPGEHEHEIDLEMEGGLWQDELPEDDAPTVWSGVARGEAMTLLPGARYRASGLAVADEDESRLEWLLERLANARQIRVAYTFGRGADGEPRVIHSPWMPVPRR